MSSTAQYAATPWVDSAGTTTADASYTAPTNTTVGVVATAGSAGGRIDNLDFITQGTSVAGLLRLFLCSGTVGVAISSITSVTTTATCATATAHTLITGDLITITGAYPLQYNVKSVAVTVTGATTFTFTIVSAASVAASTVGEFSSTNAAAQYRLIKEIDVVANTGSSTNRAFFASLNSQANAEFMPIIVPPGWSLRTTVSVTQTHALLTVARGGQF